MSELALLLWFLYGVLAFGLRVTLHFRRTGSSGFEGPSGRPWSLEWLAGVGLIAAIALGVTAAAVDDVAMVESLDGGGAHTIGIVLYGAGLVIVVGSQRSMGSSWRIGVDEAERTELVTAGPFALVRNPIFTGMLMVQAGLALLVPNAFALAGLALLLASLEAHTRLVEEPYLLDSHGDAYAGYAARVGRFLPGVGRL